MFGFFRARFIAAAAIALSFFYAAPAAAAEASNVVSSLTATAVPAPAVVSSLPPAVTVPASTMAPAVPVVSAPAQPRSLHDLVISFVDFRNQDAEQLCLAKAIYFEARGETLEGQLAVAEVVLNRTRSGVYPPSICAVVTQPAQFSFVLHGGRFPPVDASSDCWHKALAIADIAAKRLATSLAPNVLWYHANYVAPAWGRQKTRAAQIGTHIFYS